MSAALDGLRTSYLASYKHTSIDRTDCKTALRSSGVMRLIWMTPLTTVTNVVARIKLGLAFLWQWLRATDPPVEASKAGADAHRYAQGRLCRSGPAPRPRRTIKLEAGRAP